MMERGILHESGGGGAKSRAALDEAVRANGYVAAYLLGTKRLPKSLPPFVSPGDDDEAVDYAARCIAGWRNTPGAIEWLRERLGTRTPAPRAQGRGEGGLGAAEQLRTTLCDILAVWVRRPRKQ